MSINDKAQSLQGLEAAYRATYGQSLASRVIKITADYNDPDQLCCELNGGSNLKPVPCEYSISELCEYYRNETGEKRHARELRKLRAAMREFLEWNDPNGEYDDPAMTLTDMSAAVHAEMYANDC